MADFKPHVTFTQSIDGKTITVIDDSNYGEGNAVTLDNILDRSITVTDGNGDPVFSGEFTTTSLTFDLDADAYLSASLDFTLANNSHVTATVNYLASGYYSAQAVKNAKRLDCDCCSGNLCDNTLKALASKEGAEFYFTYGFGENAQTLITNANLLLS